MRSRALFHGRFQLFEGAECRCLLRFFFRMPGTGANEVVALVGVDSKGGGMDRPVLGCNDISYRLMTRLQKYLQTRFGIGHEPVSVWILEKRLMEAKNKRFGHIDAAVQVNGSDDRFVSIRECPRAFFTMEHGFAMAQPDQFAQFKTFGEVTESFFTDEAAPQAREFAFRERRIRVIEVIRNDDFQDGVAEEFKPLIVRVRFVVFRGIGGMRQGTYKQLCVPECVRNT